MLLRLMLLSPATALALWMVTRVQRSAPRWRQHSASASGGPRLQPLPLRVPQPLPLLLLPTQPPCVQPLLPARLPTQQKGTSR